jgi:hypothetical protein
VPDHPHTPWTSSALDVRVVGNAPGEEAGGGASGSRPGGGLDGRGIPEVGLVRPEVIGRQRWETQSTAGDVLLLVWISRFRFVTAEAVGERFGISVQRSRARLRRLERVGLLGSSRGHVSQAKAFWITGRGREVIGQRRRRPPQVTQAREHEEAIVALATRAELDPRMAGGRVLTERECRAREWSTALDRGRYSVEVHGADRGDRTRWPDLVMEVDGCRTAVEIEFSPKYAPRLAAIVAGYRSSSYEEVRFYVISPRLGARIAVLAADAAALPGFPAPVNHVPIIVLPWPGVRACVHP